MCFIYTYDLVLLCSSINWYFLNFIFFNFLLKKRIEVLLLKYEGRDIERIYILAKKTLYALMIFISLAYLLTVVFYLICLFDSVKLYTLFFILFFFKCYHFHCGSEYIEFFHFLLFCQTIQWSHPYTTPDSLAYQNSIETQHLFCVLLLHNTYNLGFHTNTRCNQWMGSKLEIAQWGKSNRLRCRMVIFILFFLKYKKRFLYLIFYIPIVNFFPVLFLAYIYSPHLGKL